MSLQALVHLGRLWMDMFKTLDLDDDREPVGYTDTELERLIDETLSVKGDPGDKRPHQESPEGEGALGDQEAPQGYTDIWLH